MRQAVLADGTILQFPDETLDAVMDRAVRQAIGKEPSGAGGGFAVPTGLTRAPGGQLQLRPPSIPGPTVARAAPAVIGGLSRLARGVAPLPWDIAGALGSEKAARFADIIRKNIPEIPATTTVQDMGQALVQYGLPGTVVTKLVNKVLQGVPAAIHFVGTVLSGGAADITAALPEEKTLGDMIGGPTKTKPGEPVLVRKAKIGAEGVAIPTALVGTGTAIGKVGRKVGGFVKPLFAPRAAAKTGLKKMFAEQVVDTEKAIANIDKNMELAKGGFQPTAGTAAGDVGLLAFEKGAATAKDTSVWFQARINANKKAVADQLEAVTRREMGGTEFARTYFIGYRDELLKQANAGIELASGRLMRVQQETSNFIAEFAQQGGRQADASTVIDEFLGAQLTSLTRTKNALYSGIDPRNIVEIPKERIRDVLNQITASRSPLDAVPSKLPEGLIGRLAKAVDPKDATPLTFGALQDLRPDLSEAITTARAANQGGVVERLAQLKDAINMEAYYLAEAGGDAAQRAKRANTFYAEEYVPRFKQGVGDAFRRAERRGAPFAPTTIGKRFLAPASGAREAAVQLRSIIETAPNKIQAEVAIRDHIIGDVADLMVDGGGKINKGRLDRYLKSRPARETLEQFPEIRKEIVGLRDSLGTRLELENVAAQDVLRAKEAFAKTQRDLTKNATRFFVDADPVNAIGRAINSQDPIKAVGELASLAAKDPTGEAKKGLQIALGDFLENTLRGTREIEGQLEVLQGKVSQLLNNPRKRKALSLIYSPQDMVILDRVQNQIRLMDRINQQVTTGSPTAALQQHINRARIVMASWYGIVKGRGIFAISRWIQEGLGMDPLKAANDILLDAMLDPNLAKTMLVKETAKNREWLKQFFINYRIHNLARQNKE